MVDDYELLPHEELENLRKEIQHLKKNPYPDSKENKTLLATMRELNTTIKKLIKIFEGAEEDLIKEYSEASPTKLLREISEQNAKIAEGLVALSGMVKKEPATPPKQMPKPPIKNPISSPQPINPNPSPAPPFNASLPPIDAPDLTTEEKKGFFNKFKK